MEDQELHPRITDPEAWERHCSRAKRCGRCRSRIIWLHASNGRQIPCDFASVGYLDTKYKPKVHMAHHKTCPWAGKRPGKSYALR